MTVIRPNSISGVTSITALANEINVFKHDGVLAGLQLNGVNHHTSSGVSTFHTLNVLGNVSVGGTLTYQDVTNVDSLGIGTFRTGINVSGGQLDVGSNIKLGNAGVVTAAYYVGSGAASLSPSSNADELVIGASNGTRGITIFGATSNIFFGDSGDNDIGQIQYEHSDNSMRFNTNASERLRIHSTGQISINSGNTPEAQVDIYQSGQSSTTLSMLIGANEGGAGGQGRTNSNAKAARIGCPHYTNAEESMNILVAYSGATTNNLYWGGGTGVMNSATSHHFYTAANNTTTGGTERLRIASNGSVSINYAGTGDNTLHIGNTSNAGGIIIKSPGDHYSNMVVDSNRSGANNGIFNLAGRWNGNDVAYISFTTGSDTTNKDDGYIKMYTRESGQSLTEKVRIDTTGSVRLLDFSTAVDSGADDFVVGTTNSGINRGITILSHTGADARICFATASDPDEGMIKYSHGSDVMQFFVNAAERMRIQNLGDAEYGMKFFDNKAIEFKSNQSGIFSNTFYINPNTWTNFFSIPDYFQAWVFINGTHNAGNSSALWSFSKSSSGGAHCNRYAHDNLYGPATVTFRINGVWVQIRSSYTTYGYAIINATAGGNGVANLAG